MRRRFVSPPLSRNEIGRRWPLVLAATLLPVIKSSASPGPIPVDLELVLAVDVSASMTEEERYLQRQGYVETFWSAILLDVIRAGPLGRIAVTYVEWGDPTAQKVVVPWALVSDETSAHAVAELLASAPINHFFATSITEAIRFSAGQFSGNGFISDRHVIDLSSDGPNNTGAPVEPARDEATDQGVTINGLPIMIHVSWDHGLYSIEGLDLYFEDCVVGGSGAFVVPVRRREDFAAAIQRKLSLEIAGRARLPQA